MALTDMAARTGASCALGWHPDTRRRRTTEPAKPIGLVSDKLRTPLFPEVFDLFTRGLQDKGLAPPLVDLADETDPE